MLRQRKNSTRKIIIGPARASLKELCLNFLAENFNLVWKKKETLKIILSRLIFDDHETNLLDVKNTLLASINKIEKDRISSMKENLIQDSCFSKTVSSTTGIFSSLGIMGPVYLTAKSLGVSTKTLAILLGTSPALFLFCCMCSLHTITPCAAEKIAGCLVERENDEELNEEEIKMLPPKIITMRCP